ncbi:18590_t:CDS:2, partial [Acaulospora morrowiae]
APINASMSCMSTINEFLSTPEVNSCFPYTKTILPALTNSSQDPIAILDSICSLPKCSDSLISSFLSTVKKGCAQDLAQNNTDIVTLTELIPLYSPTRDSICFKGPSGGYCLTDDSVLVQKYGVNTNSSDPLSNVPASDFCTNCNKAIVNTYLNFIKTNPGVIDPLLSPVQVTGLKAIMTDKCGSSFLDGKIPDTTSKTTYSNSPQKSNNGSSFRFSSVNYFISIATILALLIFY